MQCIAVLVSTRLLACRLAGCLVAMAAWMLVLPSPVLAQSPAAAPPQAPAAQHLPPAEVIVLHRKVALLRATFLGVTPADRANRAEQTIDDLLDKGGPGEVTIRDEPQGKVLMIDGALALILVPDDADRTRGENLDSVTQRVAAALAHAIGETREARDKGRLLKALLHSTAATLLFVLAAWAAWRIHRAASARAAALFESRAADMQVGGMAVVHPMRLRRIVHWLVGASIWLAVAVLAYEWLVFVLTRFAFTRAWGEQLGSFLVGAMRQIGSGTVQALPNLIIAVLIFLLARGTIAVAKPVFDRAQQGGSNIPWLDKDLAVPTRRIFGAAVWLFALAMAYPYLPGAQSEAFKGISVLVGLMLTLGGSSLVGQGASGLILMYSRTLRVGEFVRINDQEGTVTELGTFTTKIRTGLGEEISMPNSLIMGSVTKNYSRTVRGSGFILDTTLTIGYDTPWRQVEAMLVEAAHRTEGVVHSPAPQVFKTGLSDFYVEYRLVCQAIPSQPRPRAEVMQLLHSQVLDVFNEHGVQIMSPHYLSDPPQAKVVPRGDWWTSPAQEPPRSAPAP